MRASTPWGSSLGVETAFLLLVVLSGFHLLVSRGEWRRYPVGFAQVLACGGYGAVALHRHWNSLAALAGAGVLALLFIYLPGMLRRAALRAAERGRFAQAARWAWLWAAVQWDAEARHQARRLGEFASVPPPVPELPPEPSRAASLGIIVLCVVPWLLGLMRGDGVFEPQISTLVAFGGDVPSLVRQGEAWRLVTAIFLHAGLIHLAVNAYALWVMGELVEDLFAARGLWILFLGGGLAGSAASAWAAMAPLGVGASGGVFAVLGATLGVLVARGEIFQPRFRKALLGNAVLMTLANLSLGFMVPQVDNRAHLGGLAAGFLLALVLHPVRLRSCPAWQKSLQALLAAGGVLLVGWAGWHAVRSAQGEEGYPARAGVMVKVSCPELGYTMSRPISWIERSEKARRIWEDPLGFALVHGGEARLPATTDPGRVLILGGHSFREVPGEEGTLFYALEDADRPLAWRFDWAAGWTRAQAALQARRLLSTLVLDRDPPAR